METQLKDIGEEKIKNKIKIFQIKFLYGDKL